MTQFLEFIDRTRDEHNRLVGLLSLVIAVLAEVPKARSDLARRIEQAEDFGDPQSETVKTLLAPFETMDEAIEHFNKQGELIRIANLYAMLDVTKGLSIEFVTQALSDGLKDGVPA